VVTWCQSLVSRQKHLQVLKYKLYVIIFRQGIYNYIPETTDISKVYSVVVVL